jgi:hypothetical protein
VARIEIGGFTGEVEDDGRGGALVRISHDSFVVATIGARHWTEALPLMRDWVGDWDRMVALDVTSDDYILEVLETLRHKYPPPLSRIG